MYKFYIKMDGDTFGPYSAKEILDLGVLEDTLVTEDSLHGGVWLPAKRFDFQDLYLRESRIPINVLEPTIRNGEIEDRSSRQEYSPSPVNDCNRPVETEMSKYNWGAFGLNWLWALYNGLYWPLLLVVINFIPYVGSIAYLGICIYLGIKGNKLAWKSKAWDNWESFIIAQKKWSKAFWWVLGISIVFVLLFSLILTQRNPYEW